MKQIKQREDIPKMYKSGMSTVEIGKKVGLAPGAISSILKFRGVKTRNNKEAFRMRWPKGRSGKLAANWKGGKTKTVSGYIQILSPNHPDADNRGYVMEHRLVAEKKIGRRLYPKEDVHHIDGDITNNKRSNLLVLSRKEHSQLHAKAIKIAFQLKKENLRLKCLLKEHNIEY